MQMFILYIPLDSSVTEVTRLIKMFRDAGYRLSDMTRVSGDATAAIYFERSKSS